MLSIREGMMGSDLTFTVRAGNNGRPWLEGHRRDPYVLCGLYLDDLGGDERRGKDLLIERYAPPMMEQPDQTSIWIVTFGLTTTQLAEQYLKDGSARLRKSGALDMRFNASRFVARVLSQYAPN